MSEQLRREGDDLAARLGDLPARLRRMAATMEDFGNPTGAADLREAATRLREADRKFAVCERALHGSELARASTHPEQGETRAFERGVREACRLMRHVDTLDKVPGARDGLPHLNPLWDGSAYVEDALVGPFADRIQRPEPEGEGEAS